MTKLWVILLQSNQQESLLLRSDKIYAVLAVVLVIFLTFVILMIRTERKVQRLEKEIDNQS